MRVVIVTGAARGIGRAVAEQLATSHWQIVCADIDPAGKTFAEFTGGIPYIVSGMKSVLETGQPMG